MIVVWLPEQKAQKVSNWQLHVCIATDHSPQQVLQTPHRRRQRVQVVTQRLLKLQTKGTPSHLPAWVHIKRKKKDKKGKAFWEVVHAKGHLDEVQALSKLAGAPLVLMCSCHITLADSVGICEWDSFAASLRASQNLSWSAPSKGGDVL